MFDCSFIDKAKGKKVIEQMTATTEINKLALLIVLFKNAKS